MIFISPLANFLPDGVTGNTSDFGSEESRFEPWSGSLCGYGGTEDTTGLEPVA